METNPKNKKSPRREARVNAMTVLFEREFQKDVDAEQFFIDEKDNVPLGGDLSYTKRIYDGVNLHREEIDEVISKFSSARTLERLPVITATILRIALYEMNWYENEQDEKMPFTVAINEAVELAKEYADDKAPGYINGILNSAAVHFGLKK